MNETEKDLIPAVELFKVSDGKIENLKQDVAELIKTDLGLGHKMELVMSEQRLLKERVEEGVAKTAYKTLEQVIALSNQITEFQHAMTLQKMTTQSLTERVNSHGDDLRWIRRGIFGVVFVTILTVMLTALIKTGGIPG